MIKKFKFTILIISSVWLRNLISKTNEELKELTYHGPNIYLNYVQNFKKDSPNLLMLHGCAANLHSFDNIIPDLAKKFQIYALDFRGHGKSGRVFGKYKIEDFVSDVVSFTKDYVKKKTIIFGHSMGGMIALMAAAELPDLIEAVILIDSPLYNDSLEKLINSQWMLIRCWRDLANTGSFQKIFAGLKEMMNNSNLKRRNYGLNTKFFNQNDYIIEQMAKNIMQIDPSMLTALLDEFDKTYEQYDLTKIATSIKCPILIIRGEPKYGSLISESDMAKAVKLFGKKLSHIQISGIGHSTILQNKVPILQSMHAFISNLKRNK